MQFAWSWLPKVMREKELMLLSLLAKAEYQPKMFSTAVGVYENDNSIVRRLIADLATIVPEPEKPDRTKKAAAV